MRCRAESGLHTLGRGLSCRRNRSQVIIPGKTRSISLAIMYCNKNEIEKLPIWKSDAAAKADGVLDLILFRNVLRKKLDRNILQLLAFSRRKAFARLQESQRSRAMTPCTAHDGSQGWSLPEGTKRKRSIFSIMECLPRSVDELAGRPEAIHCLSWKTKRVQSIYEDYR